MAGRKTKYTKEIGDKICAALRDGNTHADTAASIPIHIDTFYEWLKAGKNNKNPDLSEFSDNVSRAEAECAAMHVFALRRASQGYTKTEKKTVKKTLIKKRTFTVPSGSVLPDGTKIAESMEIVEEYPVEDVTTESVENWEFDWRAGLEWLKRRRRVEWGDSIDIRKFDDETLLRLLQMEEERHKA